MPNSMTTLLKSMVLSRIDKLFASMVLLLGGVLCANAYGAEYQETFTCPLTGVSFDYDVAYHAQADGFMLDMQPYGKQFKYRTLPECPNSAFVMYKDHFSKKEVRRLRPLVKQAQFAQQPQAYRVYRMMQTAGEPLIRQVWALQQATWVGKPAYKAELVRLLNRYLAQTHIRPRSRLMHLLLKVEMQRRLGQFQAAQTTMQAVDAVLLADEKLHPAIAHIYTCQQQLIGQANAKPSPMPNDDIPCGAHVPQPLLTATQ